jgi:hypothetical protein
MEEVFVAAEAGGRQVSAGRTPQCGRSSHCADPRSLGMAPGDAARHAAAPGYALTLDVNRIPTLVTTRFEPAEPRPDRAVSRLAVFLILGWR